MKKQTSFILGLIFALAGCNDPKAMNNNEPALNDKEPTATIEIDKANNFPTGQISDRGIAQIYSTLQQAINASGTVKFIQEANGLRIIADIKGLKPGEHGFHVHEFGDCSNNGEAAGDHFSPENKIHGSPELSSEHHAGDLGNIKADQVGNVSYDRVIPDLKLHFLLGRSIVIHENPDDFKTQPTGNSGKRIACGVIGMQK